MTTLIISKITSLKDCSLLHQESLFIFFLVCRCVCVFFLTNNRLFSLYFYNILFFCMFFFSKNYHWTFFFDLQRANWFWLLLFIFVLYFIPWKFFYWIAFVGPKRSRGVFFFLKELLLGQTCSRRLTWILILLSSPIIFPFLPLS